MTLKRYVVAEHTAKTTIKTLPEARDVLARLAEEQDSNVSAVIREALRQRYPQHAAVFEDPVLA
jgi:hypothetical protein